MLVIATLYFLVVLSLVFALIAASAYHDWTGRGLKGPFEMREDDQEQKKGRETTELKP